MTVKVSLAAATQDVAFADTIATSHTEPSYCGARTYTMTYTILPPHTILTIIGATLRLYTDDVLDVGTYNVALTISLVSYPMVIPITKNF